MLHKDASGKGEAIMAIQATSVASPSCRGLVRTGSMGSVEPAKFRDLRNGNCSKVDPVLSTGTRKSFFLTRTLSWIPF